MTKRMRWDLATKRQAARAPMTVERIPVKADESFWTTWRDDPDAMRAAGYRVRKVDDRWQVWIERGRC